MRTSHACLKQKSGWPPHLLETEERLAASLRSAEEAASAIVAAAQRDAEAGEALATATLTGELAAREAALRAEGEVALDSLRAAIAVRRARLAAIDPHPLAQRLMARLLEIGTAAA
jgi:hypothetical protein